REGPGAGGNLLPGLLGVVVALLVLQAKLDEQGEDRGVVGVLEGLDPEWGVCGGGDVPTAEGGPVGRRPAQPVVGAIVGRAPAVAVAVAEAEADAGGVEDGDGLPATAEADGTGDRGGTPVVVGTGVADGVGVGAPPSCSVQLVPSPVHVSP